MGRLEKEDVMLRFWFTLLAFIILILVGTWVYHLAEGWSYFNSLYFTIVTVTTIGYGDFVPITTMGKIFTMVFPFIGIGMAFYLFTSATKYLVQKASEEVHKLSSKDIEKNKEKIQKIKTILKKKV